MGEWEIHGRSDDWHTPKYIFDAMAVTFDLDVAGVPDGRGNVPCRTWLVADGLQSAWDGFVWMNPPFGARNAILPWLRRFVAHGDGVALTPDRSSAPWFQWIAPRAEAALFLSPKVKFERPDGSIGRSPGSGTVLFARGARGLLALTNARGLGWLTINPICRECSEL